MNSQQTNEARRVLAANGYNIQAPRTQGQVLQEQIDALKVKVQEVKQAKQTAPQRRVVLPIIQEQLSESQFADIANRAKPFPEGVQHERLLKELGVLALAAYDNVYGLY